MAQNQRQRPYPQIALNICPAPVSGPGNGLSGTPAPTRVFVGTKGAVGDAGPYTGFCGNQRIRRGRRPLHGFLREPENPPGTPAPASSPEVCRKGQKCQPQGETFRSATQGRPYDRSTKHGRRGHHDAPAKKLPSAGRISLKKHPFGCFLFFGPWLQAAVFFLSQLNASAAKSP